MQLSSIANIISSKARIYRDKELVFLAQQIMSYANIDCQALEPALLPVPRAAKLLGLSTTYTWTLVRAGKIQTVRVGKRRLVPTEELKRYVASLSAGAK